MEIIQKISLALQNPFLAISSFLLLVLVLFQTKTPKTTVEKILQVGIWLWLACAIILGLSSMFA